MKQKQVLQVTDDERVRFALRFAAMDVAALRPRALHALWRQLRGVLGLPAASGVAKVVNGRRVGDALFNDNRCRALLLEHQEDARTLLKHVRKGGPISVPMLNVTMTGRAGDPRSVAFRGAPPATFRVALAFLLFSEAGARLRVCPECKTLFVRVRRQLFCNPPCTDRATWRAYPAEKKRRARAKHYAKYGWRLGARSRRKR